MLELKQILPEGEILLTQSNWIDRIPVLGIEGVYRRKVKIYTNIPDLIQHIQSGLLELYVNGYRVTQLDDFPEDSHPTYEIFNLHYVSAERANHILAKWNGEGA